MCSGWKIPRSTRNSSYRWGGSPINLAHHGSKNDLENLRRREFSPGGSLCAVGFPRAGVHHVANALLDEVVIKLLEGLAGGGLAADLEELDAGLVQGDVHAVELLGGLDDHAFRVVGGYPVGDYDDVDGLHGLRVPGRIELGEVWLQDAPQALARGGGSGGAGAVEDLGDGVQKGREER
ncbi:unnamed protein product [Clonostachys chloroleuca]|uniref:Uncharacterized protein n=1 Tax=Clonostachys chloroleuca TaxID=1926264 RepID=A0AA35QFH3_9HYPO|nr:unnamed protein product [Clonostachys chloroleuca]